MDCSQRRIRIGILVPSSNTALEPLTQSIIGAINEQHSSHLITVHFSRFPVTRIDLSDQSVSQFHSRLILDATALLVDAQVHVIGWSGTSSGWLGFSSDEELVRLINTKFNVKATTSTLALNRALRVFGVRTLGLVTPYTVDMNKAIQRNYASIGVEIPVHGERHLGITENTAIAKVDEPTLDAMVSDVVDRVKPEAVTTFCTNLRAAQMVQHWETLYKKSMSPDGVACSSHIVVATSPLLLKNRQTRWIKYSQPVPQSHLEQSCLLIHLVSSFKITAAS